VWGKRGGGAGGYAEDREACRKLKRGGFVPARPRRTWRNARPLRKDERRCVKPPSANSWGKTAKERHTLDIHGLTGQTWQKRFLLSFQCSSTVRLRIHPRGRTDDQSHSRTLNWTTRSKLNRRKRTLPVTPTYRPISAHFRASRACEFSEDLVRRLARRSRRRREGLLW